MVSPEILIGRGGSGTRYGHAAAGRRLFSLAESYERERNSETVCVGRGCCLGRHILPGPRHVAWPAMGHAWGGADLGATRQVKFPSPAGRRAEASSKAPTSKVGSVNHRAPATSLSSGELLGPILLSPFQNIRAVSNTNSTMVSKYFLRCIILAFIAIQKQK